MIRRLLSFEGLLMLAFVLAMAYLSVTSTENPYSRLVEFVAPRWWAVACAVEFCRDGLIVGKKKVKI